MGKYPTWRTFLMERDREGVSPSSMMSPNTPLAGIRRQPNIHLVSRRGGSHTAGGPRGSPRERPRTRIFTDAPRMHNDIPQDSSSGGGAGTLFSCGYPCLSMDLYLLRHGKAETGSGIGDDMRALTPEGRKEIRQVAAWIASQGIPLALVATSPLLRARETAELMQAALDPRPSLEVWDELAPDSVMEDLVVRIARTDPAGALLLVGHEPLLSMLASRIIAGDDRARLTLAKGGVAKIREVRFGNGITGELHWLLTPRQIRWMR